MNAVTKTAKDYALSTVTIQYMPNNSKDYRFCAYLHKEEVCVMGWGATVQKAIDDAKIKLLS